jgi:hypothetical protein
MRPPRVRIILVALALIAIAAVIGYNVWNNANQVVNLRYPGAAVLLSQDYPQEVTREGLEGPVEDRVYGLPAAQAASTSLEAILAWYHDRLLAGGWSFQGANLPSANGVRENWLQGCEYLSVAVWSSTLKPTTYGDATTYPIMFEVVQSNLCPTK